MCHGMHVRGCATDIDNYEFAHSILFARAIRQELCCTQQRHRRRHENVVYECTRPVQTLCKYDALHKDFPDGLTCRFHVEAIQLGHDIFSHHHILACVAEDRTRLLRRLSVPGKDDGRVEVALGEYLCILYDDVFISAVCSTGQQNDIGIYV